MAHNGTPAAQRRTASSPRRADGSSIMRVAGFALVALLALAGTAQAQISTGQVSSGAGGCACRITSARESHVRLREGRAQRQVGSTGLTCASSAPAAQPSAARTVVCLAA